LKEAGGNDQRLELRISTKFPTPQLFGICQSFEGKFDRRAFTGAQVDRQNFQNYSQRSQLCGILEFSLCQRRNGKVWWMMKIFTVNYRTRVELVQSDHLTSTTKGEMGLVVHQTSAKCGRHWSKINMT